MAVIGYKTFHSDIKALTKSYFMKNITNTFFIILIVTMFSSWSNGQNLEVSVSGGYGMGMVQGDFIPNRERTNGSDIREYVPYSLGKGIHLNAGASYLLNANAKVGLDLGYSLGGKTEVVETDTRNQPTRTTTTSIKGNMISFVPNVTISTGGEGLSPYIRLGLYVGIPRIFLHEDFEGGNTSSLDIEYYKGVALGLNNAFGVEMPMGNMKIFGEMFTNLVNYNTKYSEITALTVNGVDELPNLDIKDIQTLYLKEWDRNKNISNNEPDEELTSKIPFSSIGLKLGVRFSF